MIKYLHPPFYFAYTQVLDPPSNTPVINIELSSVWNHIDYFVPFFEGMMDNHIKRFEILTLSKTKMSDVLTLLNQLKIKDLGTGAIEECLRKLHENQNVSENTTKPYRSQMLSDKIIDVEKKLKLNNTETELLVARIDRIITETKANSDELEANK